jgi:alkylation response protein AidB-like acyl-CoA dehydrogenase
MDKEQALNKDDMTRWQKALHERGWAGINWPQQYGGTGWNAAQQYIFHNECALANTPRLVPFGLNMVGPVIYTFGSEAQKQRFLPDILATNVWWCQGYSEPGSGSDLASLQCKAVRDGDDYLVSGSKIWTTYAHYADWIFCLVRTSQEAKRQDGISFLLIDMHSPGITVKPIITFDGGHEVNQVFFDDVRVPAENLVGAEGKGWTYAKYLLTHERTGTAPAARSKYQLKRLRELCASSINGAEPLLNDDHFKRSLARLEVDLLAQEYTELRVLSAVANGSAPGPESSILKIKGTEIQQALTELFMEAAGYYAHVYLPQQYEYGYNEEFVGPEFAANSAPRYFNYRKASIYAGSNEIQKNIIAKAVLGL